jgi:replicative DNA helicase
MSADSSNGLAHPDGAHRPRVLPLPVKLPPHCLEAERGALGSAILDNETIPDLIEVLRGPEDFYRGAHQVWWRSILRLYEQGSPCDAVTLLEDMTRHGEWEQAGGDDTFAEILDGTPHAANAKYYAQIVRQKAVARELLQAAGLVQEEAYSDSFTAEELIERAEGRLFAVGEAHEVHRSTDLAAAAGLVLDAIDRRLAGQLPGLPTGYADLDDIIDVLKPGQLIVVAARPGMGKSAWVINLCEAQARERRASLLVSLEMGREEIAARFVSGRSGVPAEKFRHVKRLTEDDRRALERARAEFHAVPLLIDDSPGLTAAAIAASARRAVRRQDARLIVVDYLQLVDPGDSGRNANREQQVAGMSRRLKELARQLRVPVIVVSQLNRNPENRPDPRPLMKDLRDSGQIEQDADIILFLHRPEYYKPGDRPGVAEVIVAKNRNGPTGLAQLVWRKELMRFENYAPEPGAGYAPPPGGYEEPF